MRRTGLAFVVLLAGCGASADPTDGGAWKQASPETAEARGIAAVYAGRGPIVRRGSTHGEASLALLSANAAAFGLPAGARDLVVTRERVDALGMAHVRLAQRAGRVPVWASEVLVHFDREGRPSDVVSTYVAGVGDVDLVPRITPADATRVAEERVATEGVAVAAVRAPELVVFSKGGTPRLAYHLRLRLSGDVVALRDLMIDAATFEVLNDYDDMQSIEASGTGALGVPRKFQVSQSGSTYSMVDTTRTAGGIRTYDAKNTQTLPGTLVASSSLSSWDTAATKGKGAAVDAHFSAGAVHDFYKATFGRSGIDGKGGAMTSTAHFAQSLDNALWDPEAKQMMYGDGGQVFKPLAGAIDVVAHEFTHGVTQAEANLVYQDQAGALNEAISDIFAALIEHSVAPDEAKNFRIGEEVTLAGYLRDMKNPTAKQQPSHITQLVRTTQDNGGVHINSGIVNNAFYLMTNGGVNPKSQIEVKKGIGWDKAGQVWYRTLTELLVQKSDFAAAAQANVKAAQDLGLAQAEQDAVQCAWIATGVLKGTCVEVLEEPVPEDPEAAPTEEGAAAPTGPRTETTVERGCSQAGGRAGPFAALLVLLGALASRRRSRSDHRRAR